MYTANTFEEAIATAERNPNVDPVNDIEVQGKREYYENEAIDLGVLARQVVRNALCRALEGRPPVSLEEEIVDTCEDLINEFVLNLPGTIQTLAERGMNEGLWATRPTGRVLVQALIDHGETAEAVMEVLGGDDWPVEYYDEFE